MSNFFESIRGAASGFTNIATNYARDVVKEIMDDGEGDGEEDSKSESKEETKNTKGGYNDTNDIFASFLTENRKEEAALIVKEDSNPFKNFVTKENNAHHNKTDAHFESDENLVKIDDNIKNKTQSKNSLSSLTNDLKEMNMTNSKK